MTDHADILRRLEAAKGASYALDLDVAGALVPEIMVLRRNNDDTANVPHTYRSFTADIDDCRWLIDTLLPGQHWTLGQNIHHHYWLCTFNHVDADTGEVRSNGSSHAAPTPALAMLSALFRALEARK